MMRRTLVSVLLLMQAAALAAMPPAESSPASPPVAASGNRDLDEIVVRGTRLSGLRAAIVEAEDRFYARYNEINEIRDFDISCIMDADTGQKKKFRRCRTQLQVRARTQEATDIITDLQRHTSLVGAGDPWARRTSNIDIMGEHATREEQFRQHFLMLVNTHPELRSLLDDREAAAALYEKERARRSKGRLISW